MHRSETFLDRLIASQRPDGGWGYRADGAACAEPTALVCLALQCHRASLISQRRGLDWLARIQKENGAVPVMNIADGPYWPTALALLAWTRADHTVKPRFVENTARAINWLESHKGDPLPLYPEIFGHDTSLIGWAWVEGTHSWIEPTASAVRALIETGHRNHSRVREGIRLMLDRVLPDGGWNYGNTRVLANTLRPFPATTGVALYALSGEPRDERIQKSIRYLVEELPRIRAPFSLGWGLLGLSAWNAIPSEAESMLVECAARMSVEYAGAISMGAKYNFALPVNVLEDALFLWAHHVVSTQKRERVHVP